MSPFGIIYYGLFSVKLTVKPVAVLSTLRCIGIRLVGLNGKHLPDPHVDPLVKRAVADALLDRASSGLDTLLHELAAALEPFPRFLGMGSIQAVEVEPAGLVSQDVGCVLVCPDGELYELVLRMVPGPIDVGGVDQVDDLKKLDISPGDYVVYAYAAVRELARILEEQVQ